MKYILSTLSLFFILSYLSAQEPIDFIEKNPSLFQQESIFIHYDKSHYLPGETIWLKAYLLNDLLPSYQTTGLKLELINDKGMLVAGKIFPVLNGTSNGNITLPKELPAGNYLIRAYTRWMTHFSVNPFYYKQLVIGIPVPSNNHQPVFHYYPEGGQFVNDLDNIMGVTCTNVFGEPLAFTKAAIISNDGDTVVQNIANNYKGFGKFAIHPQEGKTYKGFFEINGIIYTEPLPLATASGVALMVGAHSKGKFFTIASVGESPALVLGHMGKDLLFKARFPDNTTSMEGIIPITNLPGGILTIAVFSKDHRLLAQRQTYINNPEQSVIARFYADTVNTQPRSKNVMRLQFPDSITGVFSVSVSAVTEESAHDKITESLLVYSKLEDGFVKLNGLLEGSRSAVEAKTDLVLLTANPKQLKWKELLQKQMTAPFTNDRFLSLEGVATSDGTKIIPNASLNWIIQTKDSSVTFMETDTDQEGKFKLDGLLFEDTATFFYQGNGKKMKEKMVKIQTTSQALSADYKAPLAVQLWITKLQALPKPNLIGTAAETPGFDRAGMLENITITARKKSPTESLNERYSKGIFASNPRTLIDLVNNPPVNLGGNVFQYLSGRYSYLRVSGNIPFYTVQFRNSMTLAGGPVYMDLYLDEMLTDAATICTVPMNNIAMVKVFGSGFLGGGGALVVYTKKAEDGYKNNFNNLQFLKVEGYAVTHTFEAPDYENPQNGFVKKDNRTTLYWNPNHIVTEDQHALHIRFYNNDHAKKFRLMVQGYTSEGVPYYYEQFLEKTQ